MPSLRPRVDGQAVVEGVMLRTAEAYAVAVRRPTGEVVVRRRALPPRGSRFWSGQLPLLRALVRFFDALYLAGLACWFALVQGSGAALATADVGAERVAPRRHSGATVACATLAFVTAILPVAFVLLPAALDAAARPGWQLLAQLGWPHLAAVGARASYACLQATFLPLYLAVVAQLPPLRRLCGYHGAEHKVRAAFARGLPLNLTHARRPPAQVADCSMHGAFSFGVLATVAFLALPALVHGVPGPIAVGEGGALRVAWAGCGLRLIALLPLLALHGELHGLRRRGRDGQNACAAPGGVQDARGAWRAPWTPTIREPDAAMLEVALAAMHALMEGAEAAEPSAEPALGWRRLQGAVPAGTPSARQALRQRGSKVADGKRRPAVEDLCCTN